MLAQRVLGESGVGLWGGWWTEPQILAIAALDPTWDASSKWSLEKDGLPAVITGTEGSYLSLKFFDTPTYINSMTISKINIYSYIVTDLLRYQVSADGTNWTTILEHYGDTPVGESSFTLLVKDEIIAVRMQQTQTGVSMGIDAVEVTRPLRAGLLLAGVGLFTLAALLFKRRKR